MPQGARNVEPSAKTRRDGPARRTSTHPTQRRRSGLTRTCPSPRRPTDMALSGLGRRRGCLERLGLMPEYYQLDCARLRPGPLQRLVGRRNALLCVERLLDEADGFADRNREYSGLAPIERGPPGSVPLVEGRQRFDGSG